MPRLLNKVTILLLVLVVFLSGMPMGTAALEAIDQNADVYLTIQFLDDMDGQPVPVVGAQFDLYYVATVEASGSYTLAGDFKDYPVQLDNLDADGWRSLTSTLLNYVHADNLVPLDTGKTNEEGILVFPNTVEKLSPGLYLVDAKEKVCADYTYQAEPFMVCLPGVDAAGEYWQYRVGVRVKYSKEPNVSYDTIDRRVLKVWEGDAEQIRPDEVVIELRKNGEVYETVTLNATNDWRHLWEDLPRYDDAKQKIEWSVVEQETKDYKVTVTLEGITFKVTNTYDPEGETSDMIRRVVQKNWDDKGYESKRPQSITVHLLCNDKTYDTQTLSASNDWQYTWDGLSVQDEQGKNNQWTIREDELSDYIANYVQLGDYFLITNSIKKPSLPQTGVLWWPVPVLVAAGLLMLILGKLLKGREEHA